MAGPQNFPVEVYNETTVPRCPVCGSEMWDNRKGKQKPYFPDFRCKQEDGECKFGIQDGARVPIKWPTGANAVYVDGPALELPPELAVKEAVVVTSKINGQQLGNAANIASNMVIAAGFTQKELESGVVFNRFSSMLHKIYSEYKDIESGKSLLKDPAIAALAEEVKTWTEDG